MTGFAVEGGPEISLSVSTLALETIKVGENAVQGTITNPGVQDLSITGITLEGRDVSEFDVSPTSATIAPGGTETITITFDPASIGNKSVTVHVDHNAGDQLTVDLTAVAEGGPVLGLQADVVSFDGVEAETTDQGSFTITNPGTEDLLIRGIIVEGTHASEYEVPTTQVTIASGGSETITVIFSPTSAGTKSASLLIDHNAGDPTNLRLSGVVYAAGTSPDFDGTGKWIWMIFSCLQPHSARSRQVITSDSTWTATTRSILMTSSSLRGHSGRHYKREMQSAKWKMENAGGRRSEVRERKPINREI